jgi:hypothetical protein
MPKVTMKTVVKVVTKVKATAVAASKATARVLRDG